MKKTMKRLLPLILAAVLVLGFAAPAMAASITGSANGIYAVTGRVTDSVTGRGCSGEAVKLVIAKADNLADEVYKDTLTTDSKGYYKFPDSHYADLNYGKIYYQCTISIDETSKHESYSESYSFFTPERTPGVGHIDIVTRNIQIQPKLKTVTVSGGTFEGGGASGDLAPGQMVTLNPAPAPEGQVFDKWQCLDENGTVIEEWPYYSFYLPEGTASLAVVYKAAPSEDPNGNTDGGSGTTGDGSGTTGDGSGSAGGSNAGDGSDNTGDGSNAGESSGSTSGDAGSKASPKTGGEVDSALLLTLMGVAAAGVALSVAMLRSHAKSGR